MRNKGRKRAYKSLVDFRQHRRDAESSILPTLGDSSSSSRQPRLRFQRRRQLLPGESRPRQRRRRRRRRRGQRSNTASSCSVAMIPRHGATTRGHTGSPSCRHLTNPPPKLPARIPNLVSNVTTSSLTNPQCNESQVRRYQKCHISIGPLPKFRAISENSRGIWEIRGRLWRNSHHGEECRGRDGMSKRQGGRYEGHQGEIKGNVRRGW